MPFVFSRHIVPKNTSGSTAACDHPRPRAGVDTLLALGIGGFVTGPTGPGTWQPSWCSTPSLGAWPCLRGASAPALPVHQGAQCDVVWGFTRSKIGPAGIGLMVSRSPYQGLARGLLPILHLAVISLRSAGPGYEGNFDGFNFGNSFSVRLFHTVSGSPVVYTASCLQSYSHVRPPTSVMSS